MNKQTEALKMAIEWIEADWKPTNKEAVLKACKEALAESEKQEPVAWMEEYQSCKVNEDERLCHSDKVFRLVQLLASQLGECQSLCAKYAEETVKNGEQKLKEVTAIKEVLAEAEKQEPVALPPIERDEDMNRTYIPIAGGWEIQTKGNGSTFRICNTKTGERMPVIDEYLQKMLETMARENREATHPAPSWQGLSDDEVQEVFNLGHKTFKEFAHAIEQALKEKNHG